MEVRVMYLVVDDVVKGFVIGVVEGGVVVNGVVKW